MRASRRYSWNMNSGKNARSGS